MPTRSYSEKLTDPRWLFVRWHVIRRDNKTCQHCGYIHGDEPYRQSMHRITDQQRWLEVHHQYYLSGHDPWDYPPHALVTLCNVCHRVEGGHEKFLDVL